MTDVAAFLQRLFVTLPAVWVQAALPCGAARAAARPNVLWIPCEDTSPHLGCYGDPLAATPHLAALAKQAVRHTRAFAYTGVCAPSRSCLITGVYPLRLGSHHRRSTTRLPDAVKCFSEYLRGAGYYRTNNVTTDSNFAVPKEAGDESSNRAHWRNRKPGQPFFSVFNFTVCHQSQSFCDENKYQQNTQRLTPEQRQTPRRSACRPSTPIRRSSARSGRGTSTTSPRWITRRATCWPNWRRAQKVLPAPVTTYPGRTTR